MRRRDYLKIAGTAVAGGSLATGVASAYDRVIDVVADIGVDNSGDTPIDADLEPYLRDGVLLEFPDGQYRIDQLTLYGLTNFGMRATGSASLIPGNYPTDGQVWIGGGAVRNLLFEGFLIDTTGAVGPTIGFSAYGGLVVRDIEKVGAHETTQTAFSFTIWDPDGYGLIENLRATDGDIYGDSVGATGIYTKSAGSITFKDCRLEDWGDNGLYASDATGPVLVKGGYFANNNISQVRLSSEGSFVRGATIRVDTDRGGVRNMRGVRVCEGPGQVDVIDCDISMERGQGSGGVVTAFDGGSVSVVDSRIHVGRDYTTVGSDGGVTSYGILVDEQTGISGETEQVIHNTSITGGGNRGSAILLRRGNTRVTQSCIEQSGTGRDGVVYQTGEGGNVVSSNTINVPGVDVDENWATVSVWDISNDGSCVLPSGTDSPVHLPSTPIPEDATSRARPAFGTSSSNPTAIVYGRYTDPGMRDFVGSNFGRLIEDFVQPGRLNLQIRTLPQSTAETFLTQLGLGVWDKEPRHYASFFEYVFDHQGSLAFDSVSEAQMFLRAAGIDNYGWIPWLAYDDAYLSIIHQNQRGAAKDDLSSSPDFPPLLYLSGDVAAPQYSYDGIYSWLEQRL